MKNSRNILYGILLCLCAQAAFGQIGRYSFQRALDGASEKWQKVVLPEDLYGKVSRELNDIRIYGITRTGDTVETPYLMRVAANNTMHRDVSCLVSGKSKKDTGYVISFENPTNARVNHIFIDLDPTIAERPLKLEESRDGNSWRTVTESCDVSYGPIGSAQRYLMRLSFRATTMRHLRLSTQGTEKPQPKSLRIAYEDISDRVLRGLAVKRIDRREDRTSKCTELVVEVRNPVPMEWIKLHVHGTSDYYRPVTIAWLDDSIKTPKGWIYNYVDLASGVLTSDDTQAFRFRSTIVKKFRIIIENQDSPPLKIDSIEVKGCVHELAVKLEPDVNYVLAYGNASASRPTYDIERFTDNVPYTLSAVSIGQEQTIAQAKPSPVVPLITNKAWFWLVMAAIIVVLGWFSIRMLRAN